MERLTVLYDGGCSFCLRCRDWLARGPALLELAFVRAGSEEARRLLPGLPHPDPPEELVVVDDEGGVYREPDAWQVVAALTPFPLGCALPAMPPPPPPRGRR